MACTEGEVVVLNTAVGVNESDRTMPFVDSHLIRSAFGILCGRLQAQAQPRCGAAVQMSTDCKDRFSLVGNRAPPSGRCYFTYAMLTSHLGTD